MQNFDAIQNTTAYISEIIENAKNILEVYEKGLTKITSPRAIFTQDNELD